MGKGPEVTNTAQQDIDQIVPSFGVYVREFFARKSVLAGTTGAVMMVVALMTLPGSLPLHLLLAVTAALSFHRHLRLLADYARRRVVVNVLAAGDRARWHLLAAEVLPQPSVGEVLKRFGSFTTLFVAFSSVVGAWIVVAATTPVEVVNGVALFATGWLYALAGAYYGATKICDKDRLVQLWEGAQPGVTAEVDSELVN